MRAALAVLLLSALLATAGTAGDASCLEESLRDTVRNAGRADVCPRCVRFPGWSWRARGGLSLAHVLYKRQLLTLVEMRSGKGERRLATAANRA